MNFSLIIPVAPERKAYIIDSIRRLDYPESDFEVLVTRGPNPSVNRNQGARQARGEFLVFLDDDASLPDNYLREAETFFRLHPQIDIVGGPQLTAQEDNGFARISWYALSSRFGAWKVANRYSAGKVRLDVDETAVSSANLLCRLRVLKAISFDTRLFPGEDPKFIAEARKAGFRIAFTPTIQLYHQRRPTLPTLMKQIYSYGHARPQKETFRETLRMPFFFLPSLLVLYLAGLLAYSLLHAFGIIRLMALTPASSGAGLFQKLLLLPLILYALLALSFGIYDAFRNREYKAMVALPLIYPAIHLSYGWGMICGYVKKIRRR